MKTTRKNGLLSPRGRGAGPMTGRIFATIRNRIITNEYTAADGLPPELDLAKEFKVSRHTIRASLQKLVVDGFIERRRGVGTTIAYRDPQQGNWAVGSLDQMLGGVAPGTVLFAGTVSGHKHPDIAKLFGVGKAGSLFQLIRVLESAKGTLSYSTVFARPEVGARIPRKALNSDFFLLLIERHCGLHAFRARQVASAAMAPQHVREALGIGADEPALVLRRTFYSRSGEPIQHVEMYCHADQYPQIVDFYRDDEMSATKTSAGAAPRKKRTTSAPDDDITPVPPRERARRKSARAKRVVARRRG